MNMQQIDPSEDFSRWFVTPSAKPKVDEPEDDEAPPARAQKAAAFVWTDDLDATIIAEWKRGKSAAEIAKVCGCTASALNGRARSLGVRFGRHSKTARELVAGSRAEAIALSQAGA